MAQTAIHPKYFQTQVTCITCNNEFVTGSTKQTEIRVDICSNCHPFYTGKQSFVSAKGRVERFLNKASKKTEETKVKKVEKERPKSQKEINLDNFKTTNKASKQPDKEQKKEKNNQNNN